MKTAITKIREDQVRAAKAAGRFLDADQTDKAHRALGIAEGLSQAASYIDVGGAHSRLEVEAALCLWEDLLERMIDGSDDYDDALDQLRSRVGSVALRHACIDLAPWVLAVHDLIPEEIREGRAYDWEIVPAIAKTIVWGVEGGLYSCPSAEDAAADVVALFTPEKEEKG